MRIFWCRWRENSASLVGKDQEWHNVDVARGSVVGHGVSVGVDLYQLNQALSSDLQPSEEAANTNEPVLGSMQEETSWGRRVAVQKERTIWKKTKTNALVAAGLVTEDLIGQFEELKTLLNTVQSDQAVALVGKLSDLLVLCAEGSEGQLDAAVNEIQDLLETMRGEPSCESYTAGQQIREGFNGLTDALKATQRQRQEAQKAGVIGALQSISISAAVYEEDNKIAMEQKKQRNSVVLDTIPFGGWDQDVPVDDSDTAEEEEEQQQPGDTAAHTGGARETSAWSKPHNASHEPLNVEKPETSSLNQEIEALLASTENEIDCIQHSPVNLSSSHSLIATEQRQATVADFPG